MAIELQMLVTAQKPNRITNAEYQHISHHSTKPMLVAGFFSVYKFKIVKICQVK